MVTRCHSLSLVVPLVVIPCHLLSLFVICCHSLSFVDIRCITCCHSLSFVVTRCITRCHSLSFDVLLACLFINDRIDQRVSVILRKSNHKFHAQNMSAYRISLACFSPDRYKENFLYGEICVRAKPYSHIF